MTLVTCLNRLTCALAALVSFASAAGAPPKVASVTLKNSVRVGYLHIPDSSNLSILSFLPMGLAGDEADRCGWAHLVEHLVIRTTTTAGLTEVNAETLADHTRLDFYGTVNNWREGLSHHRRWLAGLPFTEQTLLAEITKANSEADSVAPRLFTHKFAFAAWGQALRHGRAKVGVKGDLTGATLKEIQRYRDQHLFNPNQTFICAIGGVQPEEFFAAVEASIGNLSSQARPARAASTQPSGPDVSWDLGARHLMLVWPAPPPTNAEEHTAMMVAAQCVSILCTRDATLKKLTGPILAGTDLHTPEGWFFYVSAALRPESSIEETTRLLKEHVLQLKQLKDGETPISNIAQMLAGQMKPQDPGKLKAQMPPGLSRAMIEAQVGITWGTSEFRYGPQKETLIQQLNKTSPADVRRLAKKWLDTTRCAVLSLHPQEE